MHKYELTIVLAGKATAAKVKAVKEKLEKLVKTFGGAVSKTDNWGERELAYPIAKNTTGTYVYFELELEPSSAVQLNFKLKLDENIVRYLIVRD